MCPYGNGIAPQRMLQGLWRDVDSRHLGMLGNSDGAGTVFMSDMHHHDRRQVLKVIIGGVATALVLPSKWSKPLVSTIVAPAHAQASKPSTTKPPTTSRPRDHQRRHRQRPHRRQRRRPPRHRPPRHRRRLRRRRLRHRQQRRLPRHRQRPRRRRRRRQPQRRRREAILAMTSPLANPASTRRASLRARRVRWATATRTRKRGGWQAAPTAT